MQVCCINLFNYDNRNSIALFPLKCFVRKILVRQSSFRKMSWIAVTTVISNYYFVHK